ncbi:glycosyltransferase family 39 protein [Psychromicrobium xiongbiense]|uniref:glycosyltransferase family 39 protein n=1 Tax=Psychromicrobium xiongbiense TaxID=3051184 RepID=UPI002553C765|nr:glycosyltransferase family 39 protein [Psychromicrobium sp. YIM S02556]
MIVALVSFIIVAGLPTNIQVCRELVRRVRGWRTEPIRHHRLTAAPGLIFCGILAFILLGVFFWPVKEIANYNYALNVLGAIVALLVLPPLYCWCQAAGEWLASRRRWVRPVFLCVTLVIAFVVQLRVGLAMQVAPGWDASAIEESAFGVADGSMRTIYDFFPLYPNNLMLIVALTRYSQTMLAWGIGPDGLLYSAVVLNCVVLTATVLLVYLCARRILHEGAAVFTLIPAVVFIVFSPYIPVVYSDTLGIIFPVLLLYLHLTALRVTHWYWKVLLWIAIGAVTAVGFNLKPTAAFAGVAILGVYVLQYLLGRTTQRRQKLKVVVVVLVTTMVGFVGMNAAVWADIRSQSYIGFNVAENTRAVPWTHFLAMGATGMGAFTQSDVNATIAISDPAVRFQHGLDLYGQRVVQMGFPGYLQFLDGKAVWTFGDGSFHAWGEGTLLAQKDPFPVRDPLSSDIQSYLWGNGDNYAVTTGIWQSCWLAMLILVAVPLRVRTPRLLTSPAAIMRWSLLALTLFLLFFETRSRYLYLYVPYFILLATLTLDALRPKQGSGHRAGLKPTADTSRGQAVAN